MDRIRNDARLANVTIAIARNVHAIVITMIEFLLVIMLETKIINQTQRFRNIDRCLYFAERLTKQPMIPSEEGDKRITAYCKPVNK